jgi:hypothetical protein
VQKEDYEDDFEPSEERHSEDSFYFEEEELSGEDDIPPIASESIISVPNIEEETVASAIYSASFESVPASKSHIDPPTPTRPFPTSGTSPTANAAVMSHASNISPSTTPGRVTSDDAQFYSASFESVASAMSPAASASKYPGAPVSTRPFASTSGTSPTAKAAVTSLTSNVSPSTTPGRVTSDDAQFYSASFESVASAMSPATSPHAPSIASKHTDSATADAILPQSESFGSQSVHSDLSLSSDENVEAASSKADPSMVVTKGRPLPSPISVDRSPRFSQERNADDRLAHEKAAGGTAAVGAAACESAAELTAADLKAAAIAADAAAAVLAAAVQPVPWMKDSLSAAARQDSADDDGALRNAGVRGRIIVAGRRTWLDRHNPP